MDCSLPGSSIHGIFPGKSTGVSPVPSPPKLVRARRHRRRRIIAVEGAAEVIAVEGAAEVIAVAKLL